jgi:hypothetical protein
MREGECPPFDLVETAFALWRSAAPEPVSVAERRPTALPVPQEQADE